MSKKDQIKMYVQFIILLACIGYTIYSLSMKAGNAIVWVCENLDKIQAYIINTFKKLVSRTKRTMKHDEEITIEKRVISEDEVPADILLKAVPLEDMIRDCNNVVSFSDMK